MTTTKTKFNELRDAMMQAAKELGIPEQELHDDLDKWHMSYKSNLDRQFKYYINKLNENTKLFKQAIMRKDRLTATLALVRISMQSQTLATFFQKIDDDVMRLGWGEGLKDKWSDIPEGYQAPADYDYENTSLSYEEGKKHLAAFNVEEDRLDALERRPKVLTMHKKTPPDKADD
ncbi:hypothetical protein PT286_10120 [Neisseriaceae bacterium ESL0693]|nr:hypothetical protein [Neisseriaceae bacterium ESL0693]